MGYPYISVPAEEIFEHGYAATLATDVSKLNKDTCDPDLWECWQEPWRHSQGTLAKIQSLIPKSECSAYLPCVKCGYGPHSLANHVVDRNNKKLAADTKCLYYKAKDNRIYVVLDAGWKATKSDPDDLGSKLPICKAFCHFGCSTGKHNMKVVREFAQWQQTGDTGYAFWTTDIAYGITPLLWLQHLLSYDQPNAYKPWKALLEHTYEKANDDLKASKLGFQITDGRP